MPIFKITLTATGVEAVAPDAKAARVFIEESLDSGAIELSDLDVTIRVTPIKEGA